MRNIVVGIFVFLFLFMLGAAASADNQLGVADKYKVTFTEKILVADTLLPKGDYEVTHVMEGSNHIMVFRQVGTKKPVEARAKCTLVPLESKADTTQQLYVLNAANERVLHELIFKGDRAKHVF